VAAENAAHAVQAKRAQSRITRYKKLSSLMGCHDNAANGDDYRNDKAAKVAKVKGRSWPFKVSLFSMFNNMDAYPLSIKATIDESQLRNATCAGRTQRLWEDIVFLGVRWRLAST
jgi:hypothetical protein